MALKLDRRRLKDSDFAIPADRAYPIPDRLHARLALDDATGKEVDPRRRAVIRRAVSTRFPELAQDAAHDHMREISDNYLAGAGSADPDAHEAPPRMRRARAGKELRADRREPRQRR